MAPEVQLVDSLPQPIYSYRRRAVQEAKGEDHWLQNSWKESDVDVVVVFVRNSNWGVVGPAFSTNRRRLNHEEKHRFQIDGNDFLKEFHKLEV